MVLLRRLHQRRLVVPTARIGVCIGLEQRPHDCGVPFRRGNSQGRSVATTLIDIGATLDECWNQHRHVMVRRQHQSAVAFIVHDAGIGARLQQKLGHRNRHGGIGVHDLDQWRPIVVGSDVDVGLGSDQPLGDVDLIFARPGDMTQRSHAIFILRVGIGARLEHHIHHRDLAFGGSAEEQGPAL